MAKWLDKLEDAGRKAVADARPPRPKPEIQRVAVTMRYADPETGDPGAARYGWFYVEDGMLHMVDEAGNPLGGENDREIMVALEAGSDARAIAAALTKNRSRGDRVNGFEPGVPLRYPPGRYGC
jgi:hypothetical protein